jgi:hypothetical protein
LRQENLIFFAANVQKTAEKLFISEIIPYIAPFLCIAWFLHAGIFPTAQKPQTDPFSKP